MFDIKLGTFVALGVRGSRMIENCSINLGEFYVKMGKTNRDFWRYMEMNKEQLYAAQTAMIEWLSDPHELGKKPFKIECAGEFDFNEMHYYIFKFKASLLGKWLVGVCGGFEDDDLEPCGHIFSNMQEYNETTAKNECITMVENIMAYWKEQAAKYNNQ